MAGRRGFLKLLGAAGLGGAGVIAYQDGKLDGLTNLMKPLETETVIGSVTPPKYANTVITKITFYKSGAAEVYFPRSHQIDRFGVTHEALTMPQDSYNSWKAPEFQGPAVIPLRRVIENNGPYPDNNFQMGPIYDPNESFYLGSTFRFSVPRSWYGGARVITPK